MSRVIVKGLPKYVNEERLKDHFGKRLTQRQGDGAAGSGITDVKIPKDRNGESRRFAFLGFRSEEDAFDAVEYFDKSFIDTCKLEVSMAKSFADPRVPQSMKEKKRAALKRLREREEKVSQAQGPSDKKQRGEKATLDAEIEKNKQLKEFIETMKPSNQVTSWDTMAGASTSSNSENLQKDNLQESETKDNSDVGNEEDKQPANSLLAQALALRKEGDDDSDEEYEDFSKITKKEQQSQGEPHDEEEMMSLNDFEHGEVQDNEQPNLAQNAGISDLDWLKQRRVRIKERPYQEITEGAPTQKKQAESADQTDQNSAQLDEKEFGPSEEEVAIKKITESGRLFLRNILYTATEEDFRTLFAPYGKLEEVHVALDTRTGKSKGFAYVLFTNPGDAVNAYIELDKQIFQGRLLHILPSDAKKTHRLDEFDLKNMPLKKQKALKRKADASKDTFSWNSLFMSQDAVLSSVASKLGVRKSDLIDATDASAAVKQALAEAHVIGDVRKYFESKGVNLAKFGEFKSPSERNDKVILVKNFPYGTTQEELAELFLPFGKLERFLMPPANTIAIIEYRDVTSARAAFSKLSYKRFKDGIIYLEKGPKNCFTRDADGEEGIHTDSKPDVKEAKASVADILESRPEIIDNQEESDVLNYGPTVSIFVKNLNFSTTSAQLSDKFRPFSGFIVGQVKTKADPRNSSRALSMGFGFVEFRTKEHAMAVISALDGSVLDGHRIQLKLSNRQGSSASTGKNVKKKGSSKIIVKNLPFEATRKDIFELFSSFGQLKSVRVPKKFDKSARGFAFIEFLLPKEAENAMDQLQGVHLLGRRLVMQYAEQEPEDAEEQIAKMTRKVKSQVVATQHAALRNASRSKVDFGENHDDNDGLNGI
ncbi:LAMI_0E01882g1_1 [Lachancea mirantina]|uniref:Multiple RNA-binding domain-containing protein 1 n=1 Tax=Lachancea mirantina TaxID=1230905 RepID=A0A1G4JIV1_9SACH|nr:LAMI_0E01882g1_1 [Lachancea mirantina]